jgi:hypothetical protein
MILVRLAAKLDERAEEYAHGGKEQPRTALEQFNDAPTDEEGKQRERRDGERKFHWAKCIKSPLACKSAPKSQIRCRAVQELTVCNQPQTSYSLRSFLPKNKPIK